MNVQHTLLKIADNTVLSKEAYFGEHYTETDNKFIELINSINELFDGLTYSQQSMQSILFELHESNYKAYLVWHKDHCHRDDL